MSELFELFLDGGGKKDRIIRIKQSAGSTMTENIHQRKTCEVSAVRSSYHDGITAEVGS